MTEKGLVHLFFLTQSHLLFLFHQEEEEEEGEEVKEEEEEEEEGQVREELAALAFGNQSW